jgi:hypothetical protein
MVSKTMLDLARTALTVGFAGFAQAVPLEALKIQKSGGSFRADETLSYPPPVEDASETLSGLVVEVEIRRRSGGQGCQML